MTGLVETYRGGVTIQECDAFGHLNIAYYVERFDDAAFSLMQRYAPGADLRTLGINTRYLEEFRAGDPIVISSAVIAVEPASLKLGHVASSGLGGPVTTVAEQILVLDEPDGEAWSVLSAALQPEVSHWTAEPFAPIQLPEKDGPVATILNRVKPWEADRAGKLALFGFVDRFSTANLVNMNAAGMTSTYMQEQKRGFSTFETRMELFAPFPAIGEGIAVASGMLGLGNSSVKIMHVMRLANSGRPLARMYQAGVHFDLEARRSSPLPDQIRAKASSLIIAP